jgi:DUF971 family protein
MSADPAARATPTGIELVGRAQVIVHWEDGHRSDFPAPYLRALCPCAGCAGEPAPSPGPLRAGDPLPLLPEKARGPVHPLEIEPVGYYAVRIAWCDGHAAGIYSFDYLRSICPCAECRAAGAR